MNWLLKLHKSKTVLFNVCVAVVGVLEANMHLLKDLIGTEYYGVAFIAIGMIGTVLRIVTTTPIEEK